VLRAAGLEKSESEGTISEKLSRAGLSDDELAEELVLLAKNSGNEALRLRAIETALKIKGALKDQPSSVVPSFTIVIQPFSANSAPEGPNPILFPRVLVQQPLQQQSNIDNNINKKMD
jgi:hypothetical protein